MASKPPPSAAQLKKRADLAKLLSIHMDLMPSHERYHFHGHGEHQDFGVVSSPVYDQGFAILVGRSVAADPIRRYDQTGLPNPVWQQDLWPNVDPSTLKAVTTAFYAHIEDVLASGWHTWAQGGHPGVAQSTDTALDARVSRIELTQQFLLDRVEVLEHAIQTAAAPQVAESTWISAPPSLVSELQSNSGIIADSFEQSFGVQPVMTIVAGSDTDEFSATITLSARQADRDAVSIARATGARAKFYKTIVERLPSSLLDMTDFVFSFPD